MFITNRDIINNLSLDGRFKSVCKKIAKHQYLADELYQEFFLLLCEITDDRLVEAKSGGYLEVYCIGIIHHIWSNRIRVKKYSNGSTSSLFNWSNISMTFDAISSIEWDSNLDEEILFDSNYESIKNQIEKDLSSSDRNEWFRASVFVQSNNVCKNPREFAKKSKIPYNVVLKNNKLYKEKLREKCLMLR